jgi:two-component system, NtrC family, response regulator AlgB
VRELRNAVERAVVLATGDMITPELLPDNVFREASEPVGAASTGSLEDMERQLIVRVLAESPTLEDAAQTLGINASTLWRKRYKIE